VAESTYDKFRKLLAELFMFDRADLDFGIYRIMNAKRDEVARFLDNDLLPQVRASLLEVDKGQRAQLEAELGEAEKAAALAGFDPDDSPKVQDLRQALKATGDPDALEAEVFSRLYDFFRRYYKDGDFISLRRYKEGVYAIPYEGEEVKLYWANHDQYYIKSGEYFRDYAFKLGDGRRVHFKLVQADEERDNTKAAAGQERRFMFSQGEPIREEAGPDGQPELIIPFEYRPDAQKRKREALVAEATKEVLGSEAAAAWRSGLAAAPPTEKNPQRTLLEKHLNEYTARNTFDYFIHKDLGGFLRRELDFYIKNEVMHLDDVESEGEQRVVQSVAKIKAMRRIAHKIIDFLAQLEDFQKKLWLKKKFVVETNWCVTLDRVPEELYPEIAANERQREEWVKLFAIDEIEGDLTQPAYLEPLTVEFLRANQSLVLDTAHFDGDFKDRLLASFDDLDEQTDGLLIRSENFQALNLLRGRLAGQVDCCFIDPPYNTGNDGFVYRDNYQHSSWLCMMESRLVLVRYLLNPAAALAVTIDDHEQPSLRLLMSSVFGNAQMQAQVVWQKRYTRSNNTDAFTSVVDYMPIYANSQAFQPSLLARDEAADARYGNPDHDPRGPWKSIPFTNPRSARERPGLCYPITNPNTGKIRCPRGDERAWRSERAVWERVVAERRDWWGEDGQADAPSVKRFLSEVRQGMTPVNLWEHEFAGHTDAAKAEIKALFGYAAFDNPKPTRLIRRVVEVVTGAADRPIILDFFAGSGTTVDAVIQMNTEDSHTRRYVAVEMAEHFAELLMPRVKKSVYSRAWKDGLPTDRDGCSQVAKYLRLESYEDTLNNLELHRSADQDELLGANPELREDYTLRYMLDVESAGSASLLDLDRFEDPFSYTLEIGQGSVGETRPVTVDLVETFNYLIGLRVNHVDTIRGFKVVEGASPQGERVLVIWRNTREKSNAELDEFFQKQGYNTRDAEFDVIYVNGDNNLENLRRPDETWKVRLIEDDFKRLMFDVEDV